MFDEKVFSAPHSTYESMIFGISTCGMKFINISYEITDFIILDNGCLNVYYSYL